MKSITNLIDSIRSRLFYDRPVYIPGYEYSPWRTWVLILLISITVLIIGHNLSKHRSAVITTPPGTISTPHFNNPSSLVESSSPTPRTTPAPSNIGVSFTSVSSPIAAGSYAFVSIHTNSVANCSIGVTYLSGPSKAAGLEPKDTDGNGVIEWTWKVGTKTTSGTYPIEVNCNNGSTNKTSFSVN